MRADLPTGTVTFLFTDAEGSTRLLREHGEAYSSLLAEHHRLLRAVWSKHHGVEVDTQGDAFFVAFARASDAVAAAAAAHVALADGPVRVRIGVHTGEPLVTELGYVGYDVHRAARIAAAAHGGQTLLSQSVRDLVEVPVRDLGAHRLKDLTAAERLYQLGEAVFPRLRTLFQTNLPVQPNLFVGRERELAEVAALLRNGSRFVTLTGAGGSGKTRLALHVAAEVTETFPDGVWFVPLAPLRDSELVLPAVAATTDSSGDLAHHLRDKRLLLVIDNFEQVIDAAPGLAEVVGTTSGVSVLVTSRERLHLSAEREYQVPALPLDDGVALFTERVRRFDPSFTPDDDVAEIVRALDGLPLAVELAAARIKVLLPAEMRTRLSLEVLSGGDRDLPERQRTMRATIAWSYELLRAPDQEILTALSVFPSSFALDAAEEIAGADIDALTSIVDKSLLRHAADGRFFMLATIREFARAVLDDDEHGSEIRARHAAYYLRLAESLHLQLEKQDGAAEARFEVEHDNFRLAIEWFGAVDPDRELRLVAAIARGWYAHGHFHEGVSRLELALGRGGGAVPRAKALRVLGIFRVVQGDTEGAAAAVTEALALYTELDDELGGAKASSTLANIAALRGDYRAARAAHETSIALFRRAGELQAAAVVVSNLAYLSLIERASDSYAVCKRALAVAREAGVRATETMSLLNLAAAELERGDPDAADRYAAEALSLAREIENREGLTYCLQSFAAAAALRGDAARAARLLGAADSARRALGLVIDAVESRIDQTARAAARRTLTDERFEKLARDGASLSLDDALAEGLSVH